MKRRAQRPPVTEITMLHFPFLVGEVVEVEREPFIVVSLRHEAGALAVTKVGLVDPGTWWRAKYKARRFLREWFPGPLLRAWRRARAAG